MSIGDDNFNVNKLNGGGPLRYYVDASDNLANRKHIVTFYHVNSDHSVAFKAFILAFNETYNSDWAAEAVYGRNDPIFMYKNTQRKITLTLKVPAATIGESYENLGRVQKLLQFLYPNYSGLTPRKYNRDSRSWDVVPGEAHANTISGAPLVRLQVMNLARRRDSGQKDEYYPSRTTGEPLVSDPETHGVLTQGQLSERATAAQKFELRSKNHLDGMPSLPQDGLLGVISNVNVNHNLEGDDGVFEQSGGLILPKLIEISVDFSVIHESHLGWFEDGTFGSDAFPYGAIPGGSAQNEKYYEPHGYTVAEASDTGASSGDTNADEELPTEPENADAAQTPEEEESPTEESGQSAANAAANVGGMEDTAANWRGRYTEIRREYRDRGLSLGESRPLARAELEREKAAFHAGDENWRDQ